MKEEYVDITKTGPVPLKGLNYQDDSDNLGSFERLVLSGNRTMQQSLTPETEYSLGEELATKGFGESIYDDNIQFASQADDLNEVRAIEQPWYAQIGAGIDKGDIV